LGLRGEFVGLERLCASCRGVRVPSLHALLKCSVEIFENICSVGVAGDGVRGSIGGFLLGEGVICWSWVRIEWRVKGGLGMRFKLLHFTRPDTLGVPEDKISLWDDRASEGLEDTSN
jgi:hypothetical protein